MIVSRRIAESTNRFLSGGSDRADTDSGSLQRLDSNLPIPIRYVPLMRKIPLLIHIVAWLVLAAITVWCWAASDRGLRIARAKAVVPAREDVIYQTVGRQPMRLDVYVPPDTSLPAASGERRTAVLVIHGGSWVGGSKRSFRPDARNPLVSGLAENGYVVIAVDYRLARPGFPGWQASLDDLREAVRWTHRNAGVLGIDPDRIVALGQSSGAHLAALLGTLPDPADPVGASSRVHAVVNFYGPSDLNRLAESRSRLAHDPTRVFLGDDPTQFRARADHASPINHVSPDDAPMLLFHGTDDGWVPREQSERLAEALRKAGVSHHLIMVDGAAHGFGVIVNTQTRLELLPELLDFLGKVGNARSR
jgi:acetyl esterase/lipase